MSKVSKKHKLTLTRYIPRNIDLEDLLRQYSIPVPNARDYLVYLLDLIHRRPAYEKDLNIEGTDGFVCLKSTYMQGMAEHYAPLMSWLEQNGIIEINSSYFPGKYAMGYRFTTAYLTELRSTFITLPTLIKKIKEGKKRKDAKPILKPEHLYNYASLQQINHHLGYSMLAASQLPYLKTALEGLTIDKEGAELYLRNKLTEDQADTSITHPILRFNRAMMIVNDIANGEKRFFVDSTSSRLHTLLTVLNTPLRASLRHNERLLSSADIKNSQPVLSLVFLDDELLMKNNMLQRIAIYNKQFVDWQEDSNNFSHSIMLRDFIRTHSQAEDVQLYRELVISGQLYRHFGGQLQLRGIFPPSHSEDLRKRAKKELFRAFFDRNQAVSYADSHALRVFKELFPNVYAIFSRIKSGNYKTLACALQNLEAEVVLFKTCRELAGNYPGLPLFTIHDSIATYQEDIETVKEALSRNMAEVIGTVPQIKIEHWDETLLEEQQERVNVLQQQPVSLYGYINDESATLSYQYTRSLKTAAKQLGMPPLKFNALLRERGILQSADALRNVPFDQYIEAGYFAVVEKHIRHAGLKKVKGYASWNGLP